MSFHRTASGLSNLRLFYGRGVAAIVFTEGGESLAPNEALVGGGGTKGINDIRFWEALFSEHQPRKKCTFRAVGGKQTLVEIAKYVRSASVKNVLVCMDADHDRRRRCTLRGRNILYTYGYSWENDVWNMETVKSVHNVLCHSRSVRNDHIKQLRDFYDALTKRMAKVVRFDVTYAKLFNEYPLNGCRNRVLVRDRTSGPTLRISPFLLKIRELRGSSLRATGNQLLKADTVREINGHLLSDYCVEFLSTVFRNSCGLRAPQREMIDILAIGAATNRTTMRRAASSYHAKQMSQIEWS